MRKKPAKANLLICEVCFASEVAAAVMLLRSDVSPGGEVK